LWWWWEEEKSEQEWRRREGEATRVDPRQIRDSLWLVQMSTGKLTEKTSRHD
jgi:hypothetical protein